MTRERMHKCYPGPLKEKPWPWAGSRYTATEATAALVINPALLYHWKDKFDDRAEVRALAESEREKLERRRVKTLFRTTGASYDS